MTTTKQPTESTPPTPIKSSAGITVASSGAAANGFSATPKHSRQRRSYPFWKVCPACGESFAVANCDEYHKKTCCSPACAVKVSADKRRGRTFKQRNPRASLPLDQRKGETIICPVCGVSKWKPDAWLRKVDTPTCSKKCNGVLRSRELVKHSANGKGTKRPGKGLSGANNPAWKGGVTYFKKHGNYTGVKYIRCPVEYASMARKDGYVMEHRLMVAQAIGRPLLRSEVVHHKDHNPAHNELSNFQLFASNRDHKLYEHHGSPDPIWQL